MSRFFSDKFSHLVPYVPGEQPKDMKYVKLNTNESPFPPAPEVIAALSISSPSLKLYPDPDSSALVSKLAALYGVEADQVIVSNGSDEVLNFAFAAFCDEAHPAVFADITYGFYKVFADFNRVPYVEIPLRDDFTMDLERFSETDGTLFIANPNAQTGIYVPLERIEALAAAKPDRLVVVDEAYVDFGSESAVTLLDRCSNLLVVQTFSKSRSMAGSRLGFAVGGADIIADLHTVRYSTNPYNVNTSTTEAALAVLGREDYTRDNCRKIIENREYASEKLRHLGFEMTPSAANFIFARHRSVPGETLYSELKRCGVLVRHFGEPRISDYNRITVGTREQMDILIEKIREILEAENALF